MRVSQLITRVRDRLDEATANIYSDAELVRYLDESVNDMFRLQVQHDESYNNCEHDITASTDSRTLHTDYIVYDVPTWVHKITSVRVKSDSGSRRELNIPARTLHNRRGSFWAWHGPNRIMVYGTKAGNDLTLEVSKVPAPLNAGTVGSAPSGVTYTTSYFTWNHAVSAETLYEDVYEADWYKNSSFEFTGAGTATEITGQVVTVASSSILYVDSKTNTAITFDKVLPRAVAAADTWEMHAEVPSASSGYLVALAANKALIRKSNWEAISSLSADLERERARFIEAVTPRQDQVLPYTGMEFDPVYEKDLDRDNYW